MVLGRVQVPQDKEEISGLALLADENVQKREAIKQALVLAEGNLRDIPNFQRIHGSNASWVLRPHASMDT